MACRAVEAASTNAALYRDRGLDDRRRRVARCRGGRAAPRVVRAMRSAEPFRGVRRVHVARRPGGRRVGAPLASNAGVRNDRVDQRAAGSFRGVPRRVQRVL